MQSSSSDALFYPCFVLIAFLASACETAEIDGRALIDTAGTANAASSYRANSAAGVEVLGEDSTRQVHDVSGNDLAPRPNPTAGWQPMLAETGGAQPLSGTEAIGGAIVNARAPVAGVSTPSEAGRLGSQSAEREGQAALAVAGIDSMTNAGWHIQGFSGDQTDSEALAATGGYRGGSSTDGGAPSQTASGDPMLDDGQVQRSGLGGMTSPSDDSGNDRSAEAGTEPFDSDCEVDPRTTDTPPCNAPVENDHNECSTVCENNAGESCQSDCESDGTCSAVQLSCGDRDHWVPALREHFMESINGCQFALEAPQDWAAGMSLSSTLAEQIGGRVTLAEVLDDLNRDGRAMVTNQTAIRLRNHNFAGFTWNDGDMDVSYWMPQGITGSSDAAPGNRVEGKRLMMVSWYHKTDDRPTKGARISLVDLTDADDIKYRHLLLAEPFQSGMDVQYRAASNDHGDQDALHAGGIVWFGDLLYVADTRVGFRVYDLNGIIRMSHTDQKDKLGWENNESRAHGYKYIIPLIARYRLTQASCPYSFSSLSLDRSTDPPTLLSAEYKSSSIQGRLVHWPIDSSTGRLRHRNGVIYGQDAQAAAQTRVQGALRYDGNYYISASSQFTRFGRLYRTHPGFGESSISAWVYGCEDLYYERNTRLIWTAAEFPTFRDVIGIPLRVP